MLKVDFDETYRILTVHGTNHLPVYQECIKSDLNRYTFPDGNRGMHIQYDAKIVLPLTSSG